jgi:hypothetical protein
MRTALSLSLVVLCSSVSGWSPSAWAAGYKLPSDAKVLQEMKKASPDAGWDQIDKLTWGKWQEEWRNRSKELKQPADILARDVDILFKKDKLGNTVHLTSKVRYSILGKSLEFREYTSLGVDYVTRQPAPDDATVSALVVEHLKTKKMSEVIPDDTVYHYKDFTRGAISIKKLQLVHAELEKNADNVISSGKYTGTCTAKMTATFEYAVRDRTTVKTQKIVEVTLPFIAVLVIEEGSGKWTVGSVTRFEKGDFSAIYPSGPDRMKEEYLPLEFMATFAEGFQKRVVAKGEDADMVILNYTDRDLEISERNAVKSHLYSVKN